MRTIVELDDDVAAAVERLSRDRAMGVSEAINELIRRSLGDPEERATFVQRSQALGLRIDVSNVVEALEALDGMASR
jgi:hypothetical protein